MPFESVEAARDAAAAAEVLRALGCPDAPLLGSGVECQVFAIDEETVVKVYRDEDTAWQERCEAFVAGLAAAGPPFAVPVTLKTGTAGGTRFALQRRIPGRLLADVLPGLRGTARERALLSYLDAAEAIGRIDLAAVAPALEPGFGHVLGRGPRRDASWPAFLRSWALTHLARGEQGVREDVPLLDAVLERYDETLTLAADVTRPRLVHGDYWPENVLVGDDHRITGIVDWSANVLAGDPRVDVAQAIFYLDMLDGFEPADADLLLREAAQRHGPSLGAIVDLYRLHYALMYAADCRGWDPLTYHWCVKHLRTAARAAP